jgi:dCMP deaminase
VTDVTQWYDHLIEKNPDPTQAHLRRLKWDRRYMELAKHVAQWSKDPSTKVGAVIVRDNIVLGQGYNGFPRGVGDHDERYNDRSIKLKYMVHAEPNAILNAQQSVKGATLYLWPTLGIQPCCCDCAKFVIQSGIKRVIYYTDTSGKPLSTTWADSIETGHKMFCEAGVVMEAVTPEIR